MIRGHDFLKTVLGDGVKNQVNPNSIDLRLGQDVVLFTRPRMYRYIWETLHTVWVLCGRPKKYWFRFLMEKYRKKEIRIDLTKIPGFYLKPNQLALMHTEEIVHIPDGSVGLITLKSSRGREGLDHALAAFHDTGFYGQTVLEVRADTFPVWIEYGMRLVQLIYFDGDNTFNYDGHYQGQMGVRKSVTEYSPFASSTPYNDPALPHAYAPKQKKLDKK